MTVQTDDAAFPVLTCHPNSRTISNSGWALPGAAAGATLRYLPPYSPDLNPIEAAYSACKAFLRKCAERTEQALGHRIGQFVRRLQPEVCANFFAHAGYAI